MEKTISVGDTTITISETADGCVNIKVCCCKPPEPTPPEPTTTPVVTPEP